MSVTQTTSPPAAPAISQIERIRVWDHREGGGTWILPSLSTTEAIPTLWQVLHLINSDWHNAATDNSMPQDNAEGSELALWQMDALETLKPRYIQCLFSYINFFFTLENGFQVLLSELGEVNHELSLRLPMPKRPKRTAYINKLRRVRNYTVVHWGGPHNKNELDSCAGRYWGFSWPGKAKNMTDLTFGSASLVGASDRVLQPIPDTHQLCMAYLKQYDEQCADLLTRIVAHLPKTIGTRKYEIVARKKAV